MQGADDTDPDLMSDWLVIWLGAITAFHPKCWKYADEAKLLFTEKVRSRGPTNKNFRKVCAVVRGIPKLKGIVDDLLATMNGTIKCMPLYEETMKKHEREDVACTGLLEDSESLTSHRDNLRKELVLELCESICRKIDAAKHRFFQWATDLKTDWRDQPH